MSSPIACPDCDSELKESSSERGDLFCPDCTRPVSSQDAVYYCRECGDKEVPHANWLCPDCRDDPPEEDQTPDIESETDNDFLASIAARDCHGCGTMLVPINLVIRPLHDGEGNFYVGHSCPHCGYVMRRSRGEERELAGHAKEAAELDANPPDDPSEIDTVPL